MRQLASFVALFLLLIAQPCQGANGDPELTIQSIYHIDLKHPQTEDDHALVKLLKESQRKISQVQGLTYPFGKGVTLADLRNNQVTGEITQTRVTTLDGDFVFVALAFGNIGTHTSFRPGFDPTGVFLWKTWIGAVPGAAQQQQQSLTNWNDTVKALSAALGSRDLPQ